MQEIIESTKLVDEVKLFSNGLEALEFLTPLIDEPGKLPGMILLDLSMPVMDGWEFLDEFILLSPRLEREITILIVSSTIDPSDIERARSISAVTDFIIKPVTIEKFVEMIQSVS